MMGCMCVQSFITLGINFTQLAHFICLYHNVLPGAIVVYEKIKMLLHDLSRIPLSVQSFISISYPVFEIRLSKLNNNKKKIEK